MIFCPRVSSLKVSLPPTFIFIARLKLTFVAAKPPPCHVFEQIALMAAEGSGNLSPIGRCGEVFRPKNLFWAAPRIS